MRSDQLIRSVAIAALAAGYIARVFAVGNGAVTVPFVGQAAPFTILAVATVTLALPETLEYIPFGPSRGD